MDKIEKMLVDVVNESDCGTGNGALEDIDLRCSRLTVLTGRLLQVLCDRNIISEKGVKDLLDICIW